MNIRIIPIGDIQPNILDIITRELNRRFKSKFILDSKINIPDSSYDKFRDQYNAEMLLNELEKIKNPNEKIVGVTSYDIYSGDLNFAFGEARKDVAIVSTNRLNPTFYGKPQNFDLLIKRTLKEVIHEIGHMFGLPHCHNHECVMYFANSVSYVDDKKDEFCKECTLKMSMEGIKI